MEKTKRKISLKTSSEFSFAFFFLLFFPFSETIAFPAGLELRK